MSTTIEWTQRPGTKGETWNPVVGCTKVSQGCRRCYAETLHDRRHKGYLDGKLQHLPQYAKPFRQVQLMPQRLSLPLSWTKPRTVFVNSMSDLFHEDVPTAYIQAVLSVAASCPQHTFIILTKRAARMREVVRALQWRVGLWVNPFEGGTPCLLSHWCVPTAEGQALPAGWVPPNVWLGVSVEDQKAADERIPHLLHTPAAIRFLSCEPLLGVVDVGRYLPATIECRTAMTLVSQRELDNMPPREAINVQVLPLIDWVIAGGESGPGARPMHPDWARALRDQCAAAGVPFFFKQWGAWQPGSAMDFDRNIVLMNTGEQLPYTRYQDHITKVQRENWSRLRACAMHKAWTKSGNLLDGRTHLEFPRTGFVEQLTEVTRTLERTRDRLTQPRSGLN